MNVEQLNELAQTLEALSFFQIIMLLVILLQMGLIAIIVYLIRSNSKNNHEENEQSKSQLKLMAQIYKSFSRVTESFDREQRKDWQRTQYFLKQQNEQTKLLKNIFFQIGQLSKEFVILKEDLITYIKNGDGEHVG